MLFLDFNNFFESFYKSCWNFTIPWVLLWIEKFLWKKYIPSFRFLLSFFFIFSLFDILCQFPDESGKDFSVIWYEIRGGPKIRNIVAGNSGCWGPRCSLTVDPQTSQIGQKVRGLCGLWYNETRISWKGVSRILAAVRPDKSRTKRRGWRSMEKSEK